MSGEIPKSEVTHKFYTDDDFPPMKNDNILKVAWGEKPTRTPVWIMRQAGRYLPEFRELRKEHDFFEIVNNPELACKVTMMPVLRFDVDAAIIFSDILVVPQAVGMVVKMEGGVGPVLPNHLKEPKDAYALNFDCDVKEKMKGTLDAILLTRRRLEGRVPLIGFSGAPWTLLSYMIEGGGSRTLSNAKRWLYTHPEESFDILRKIGKVVTRYLVEQVAHGAQILQIFESHADLLDLNLFRRYSLKILEEIETDFSQALHSRGMKRVPIILFAKGAHYALREMRDTKFQVIGVDWTIEPHFARSVVGDDRVLQGNLDPCALYASKEELQSRVRLMLDGFSSEHYICNLGHGIYPDAPIESVKTFIESVHTYNKYA